MPNCELETMCNEQACVPTKKLLKDIFTKKYMIPQQIHMQLLSTLPKSLIENLTSQQDKNKNNTINSGVKISAISTSQSVPPTLPLPPRPPGLMRPRFPNP